MFNKIKLNYGVLKKFFCAFIIIQPLLDYYLLYSDVVTDIFGFSPSTIIRAVVIFFSSFLIFITSKDKKIQKPFIIYLIFTIIYYLIHFIYSKNLTGDFGKNFIFGNSQEIFYFARMMMPILTIYIVYHLKLTKDDVINVIKYMSYILVFTLVVTNVFKIALVSYQADNTLRVADNIFGWFFPLKYDVRELASKGLFYSANQIGGLLMFLLPINFVIYFYSKNNRYVIFLFLQIISMLMLGTRTSCYGWMCVGIAMILLYLFFTLIKKELDFKFLKIFYLMVIFSISFFIFKYSPLVNENISEGQQIVQEQLEEFVQNNNNENSNNVSNNNNNNNIVDQTKEVLIKMELAPYIYIYYPYSEFSSFWKRYEEFNLVEKRDNRYLQYLITKDIVSRSNGKYDMILGMGYSRFINQYIYLERDIFVHLYTIGIVGVLCFIFPYIVIVLCKGIPMLIHYKKFNLFDTTIILSIIITILLSLLTGHILDELIVTLVLAFVSGYLLSQEYKGE